MREREHLSTMESLDERHVLWPPLGPPERIRELFCHSRARGWGGAFSLPLRELVKVEVDLVQPSIDGRKVGGNAISWARADNVTDTRNNAAKSSEFRGLGVPVVKVAKPDDSISGSLRSGASGRHFH